MTIGINILFLIPNQVGGTEYYTRSFLVQLEKADKKNQFVVFCNQENANSFLFRNANWKKVVCPVSGSNRLLRVLYEQLALPLEIEKQGCKLLHSFGYTSPLVSTAKRVVTVHDANWKDHPEDTPPVQNKVLDVLISGSLKTADAVITDSKFSHNRLLHHYPTIESKLHIIRPGLDEIFLKELKKAPQHSVRKKTLLCVSGFYPHKRIPYLLKLWEHLSPILPKYKLLLIGKNGADEPKVAHTMSQLQNAEWQKKVSLQDLAKAYAQASLFIFPSVYEGFGFPVYEAIAAKLPVLVGSRKPFSEVSNQLSELSFNLEKDSELILEVLKKKPKSSTLQLPNYTDSTEQLIELYNSLAQ